MGLYVNLYFNFHGVKQKEWEKVYEESKQLLTAFPVPLMRHLVEEVRGSNRYVLSSKVVDKEGTAEEYWEIAGDMQSRKWAESFELHKMELGRWQDTEFEEKDILYDETAHDYVSGNGIKLFGNKTQGYPYHLVLLAIGMLFETRFPKKAYVTGDIDAWQVENTLAWVNSVLAEPVTCPVVVDGDHLWQRLDEAYTDKTHVIERFKVLFRGDDSQSLAILIKNADKEIFYNDLKKSLGHHSTLGTLGARRIIRQWLGVTRDVQTIVRLVSSIVDEEGKSKFQLEDLLEAICNSFINIPMEERQPLSAFAADETHLQTIDEVFARTFLLMKGVPQDTNFYMKESELLEIFTAFEKEKEGKFREIIETRVKEKRKFLQDLKNQLEEIAKKKIDSPASPGVTVEEEPEEEDFILASVEEQTSKVRDPEKSAQNMGLLLLYFVQNNREVLEKYLSSTDREFLLDNIMKLDSRAGVALTERAWEAIDEEQDPAVLKGIFLLISIKNDEMSFWNWRIYILENKEMWQYIAYSEEALKNIPGLPDEKE